MSNPNPPPPPPISTAPSGHPPVPSGHSPVPSGPSPAPTGPAGKPAGRSPALPGAAGKPAGSAPSPTGPAGPSAVEEFLASLSRRYQHVLDRSTPHVRPRWIAFLCLVLVYVIRVWILQGFYIVTYGLGIYSLSLLVGFLSPMVDPEVQELIDGPGPQLPTRATDEFRPFVRRVPEFKFWHALTKAFCIAFFMTFFGIFDIPVFWPILVVYFCTLAFVTLKRQIQHMIKYKYIPFSFGKQRYGRKKEASPAEETA